MSTLARRQASATASRPVATRPAASPATVASSIWAKALLVPVESGASGTSPHADATTRLVPSPPRTTSSRTPSPTSASVAVTESAAPPVSGQLHEVDGRPGAVDARASCASDGDGQAARDPTLVHHRDHPVDTERTERGQHPLQHHHLLGVGEHRGPGDEPADVLAGPGVHDEPHDHLTRPGRLHLHVAGSGRPARRSGSISIVAMTSPWRTGCLLGDGEVDDARSRRLDV